jgi:6-pyruvoyltetrahydropterin/6-carboxytetrahydropterin synthase
VSRFATVEIHKEELKFSGGHFMIFSATERETMHGHDYQINVAFDTLIETNGLSFDCRYYRQKLLNLCAKLDYHFILPMRSEFLRLEETTDKWVVHFNNEVMEFIKRDAVPLAITNVTLEEISNWFLQQLLLDAAELQAHKIFGITVKAFNGRGESGSTHWQSEHYNNVHSQARTYPDLTMIEA